MKTAQILNDLANGNTKAKRQAVAALSETAGEQQSGTVRAQEMTDEQLIFQLGEIASGDPVRIAKMPKIHVSKNVADMADSQIEQRLKNLHWLN